MEGRGRLIRRLAHRSSRSTRACAPRRHQGRYPDLRSVLRSTRRGRSTYREWLRPWRVPFWIRLLVCSETGRRGRINRCAPGASRAAHALSSPGAVTPRVARGARRSLPPSREATVECRSSHEGGAPGRGHPRPHPWTSAELLGQPDDDAFGATHEAEPVDVFVLRDLAHEFGTVAAQAGEHVVGGLHHEHK